MNIFDCKPIIFNAEMLQAAREGKKTVTRRAIKPQPAAPRFNQIGWTGWDDGHGRRMTPPYMPGDVLYAPEPWRCVEWYETVTTKKVGYTVEFKDGERRKFCFYDRERAAKFTKYGDKPKDKWQSPYFMPREAARLFFRVTGLRVERLWDVNEEKAKAEGAVSTFWHKEPFHTARQHFIKIWDSTIKPKDRDTLGWSQNPWVWVIEFERMRSLEEAGEPAGQYAEKGALKSAT